MDLLNRFLKVILRVNAKKKGARRGTSRKEVHLQENEKSFSFKLIDTPEQKSK